MITAAPPYRLQSNDRLLDTAEKDAPYVLRLRDLPDDQKPREKLIKNGPEHLSTAELLAVLWGVGNSQEDVLAMAKRTMKEYGEKAVTAERKPEHLARVANIPLIKACQIVASFELGRRHYGVPAGRRVRIHNARQAYSYLKSIGTHHKEQLRGLYLNSRYQIIHDEVISVGSLTANIIHPREVFQPAIEYGAVGIIIAHNHPSGSLEPSLADLEITDQLQSAGKLLGIDLIDHLIIISGKYVSIMDCLEYE